MMNEYKGKDVILMTCSDCNTKCKHCYVCYGGNMTSEQIQRLTEEFLPKYNTSINGTEVIIHPEFFSFFKKIGQTRIMTNGLEIIRNPEVLSKLKESGIKIISISYHIGIHDNISAVNKSYILKVIEAAKKYGMKVRIMVTVNKYNYKNVKGICEQARILGVDSIRFTNYLKCGNAENLPDDYLSDDQIVEFLQLIEEARSMYPKDVLEIKRCGTFGSGYGKLRSNFYCPAGNDLIAITPDMSVYPCNFLSKPGFEIGMVKDGKIYITKTINNCGDKCIAREIYNYNVPVEDYFHE